MQTRLMTILNLRSGEGRNVALMLAHYFFMGAAMILGLSSSFALYFEAWDITALPFIYLGIAIIVSSITALFLKLSERTSLARFLILCISFILFGTIALRVGMSITDSKWLVLTLPVWAYTLLYLSVTAFWTLAGSIFNIRQGKRIFGLMNAGSWLAYVVIGPFTTPLVKAYGTKNLYVAIAASVFIAMILLLVILRTNPHISAPPQLSAAQPNPISLRNLLGRRYIQIIFVLLTLWHIAYFFLDNIFYDRVSLQFPGTDDLAGFIGSFFGVVGVFGFITDVFLTGRILSRFGLRAGLLSTHTLTMLSVGMVAILGSVYDARFTAVFWFAVAGRFVNEGLGFSLDQSTFAVLNQPLDERERARVQASTEGIIRPFATGLAGMLLLLLNTYLKFDAVGLAVIYLLINIALITAGILAIRAYPVQLAEALHKRRIGENGIAILDLTSHEFLQKSLNSPHPEEINYALTLLEQGRRDWLLDACLQLLDSEHPQICEAAIHQIEKHKFAESLPSLKYLMHLTEEPTVRQAAARTLTTLQGKANASLLDSPDPNIQRGAMIGLLHGKKTQHYLVAHDRLKALAASESVQDRVEAATLIGEIGNPSLSNDLLPLIKSQELSVQLAALNAAGKIKSPNLWLSVISALGLPATRNAALSALIAGGESALSEIMRGVNDSSLHRRVRIRLVKACASMKSPAAISELVKIIDYPNTALRSRALAALTACKFVPDAELAKKIREQIQSESHRAVWLLSCIKDLGDSEKVYMLVRALQSDLKQTCIRLLYLFGFIYDTNFVSEARQVFSREDSRRHAYAVEVMDSILFKEHKAVLLPLLEDYPAAEKLNKIPAEYRRDSLSRTGRIMSIVFDKLALESPWVVAVALETAIQNGLTGRDQISESLLNVKETMLTRRVEQIISESTMLSTFERVIILKSTSLFAKTPDEALAELADLLEEVEASPGDIIFEKGSIGDSLYIVARGKVAVVDGEQVLNELGERAVFGELSFFDSAPRTASIRASESTTLLRLNQAPFFDLMSDYTEVATGTIEMLTTMLRARTTAYAELSRSIKSAQQP